MALALVCLVCKPGSARCAGRAGYRDLGPVPGLREARRMTERYADQRAHDFGWMTAAEREAYGRGSGELDERIAAAGDRAYKAERARLYRESQTWTHA